MQNLLTKFKKNESQIITLNHFHNNYKKNVNFSRETTYPVDGTHFGRPWCDGRFRSGVSCHWIYLWPQGAVSPGFGVGLIAFLEECRWGLRHFLEMPGACELRPCARTPLKKALCHTRPVTHELISLSFDVCINRFSFFSSFNNISFFLPCVHLLLFIFDPFLFLLFFNFSYLFFNVCLFVFFSVCLCVCLRLCPLTSFLCFLLFCNFFLFQKLFLLFFSSQFQTFLFLFSMELLFCVVPWYFYVQI